MRRATTVLAVAVFVAACGGARNDTGQAGADPQLGQVTEALGTPPESNCSGFAYNGHDYWFCSSLRNWSTARTKCEAQGYNLVRIEDAAENGFVKSHIGLDAWTGGNDATTEGTWVWTFGGSNFWTGTASGHTVNGLFANWNSGEPNNLSNQDCAKMISDGTWRDDSCSLSLRYVCESGTDQCGTDPNKVVPGLCGCGVSDVDTDGDGTPDCQDQCPSDATKIRPGDCGCSNAPRAAGTACSDGLCAANTTCNGAGVCGNPASCPPPDSDCSFGVFRNEYYWFCDNDRPFANVQQRCQNVGMQVPVIDDAAEDAFVTDHTDEHTFIGATDQAVEGDFVWIPTGKKFWTGGENGSAVGGAYTNWESGQPSDGISGKDCVVKDPPVGNGHWETRSCTTSEAFACERVDLCPTSPKIEPGQCNCDVPDIDTDGDGTADCKDACATDPSKTTPGLCGCNIPETDADGDSLPTCIDPCDSDPNNALPGDCGCVGRPGLKSAGASCNDGICPGTATCNGQGVCGNPSSCAPDAQSCVARPFRGHIYWFCTGARSWTDALQRCSTQSGRSLVQIDSLAEDEFVARNVSTGRAWVGGNDQGSEGAWRWSTGALSNGVAFWNGGPTGSPVSGRFTYWVAGEPGGAEASDCAAIVSAADPSASKSRWVDETCGTTLPYVCEVIDYRTGLVPGAETTPVNIGDFIPGGDPGQPPPISNCVAENTALPADLATLTIQRDTQTGAFTPPTPGSTCTPVAPDPDRCPLDPNTIQPNVTCNLDSDCTQFGATYQCRPTSTCTGTGCTTRNRCGIPDPSCADESNIPPLCREVDLCTDPAAVGPSAPETPYQEDVFKTADHFPPVNDTPSVGTYQDPPCGSLTHHCWCSLGQTDVPERSQVEPPRDGNHGGASRVKFTFSPHLEFTANPTPLPFGQTRFDLHARADAVAHVHVALPLAPTGDVDILNAVAGIAADRCRIHADESQLLVFGTDFIDLFADNAKFDSDAISPTAGDACRDAAEAFELSANRAKKAFRDAQQLVFQYQALRAQNPPKRFDANFCGKLLEQPPPANFPGGNACPPGETPEDTINRFIQYYDDEVNRLRSAAGALEGSSAALAFTVLDRRTVPFLQGTRKEGWKLVEAQFAIGPIPCTLEVDAFAMYGIDGTLGMSYTPVSAVNGPEDTLKDLVSVGVQIAPHAGAMLDIFVAAGFGVAGFEAKAGIEGELTLADLAVPLVASAGLGVSSVTDPRFLPDDVKQVWSGEYKFPPRSYKYFVDFKYGASASIRDILHGDIAVKVKISALFFSVSWRKTILSFPGYGPFTFNLIHGENSLPLDIGGTAVLPAADQIGDGISEAQLPLVSVAALPPINPQPTATAPVDLSVLQKVFYDRLCVCAAKNEPCGPGIECCPNLFCGAGNKCEEPPH